MQRLKPHDFAIRFDTAEDRALIRAAAKAGNLARGLNAKLRILPALLFGAATARSFGPWPQDDTTERCISRGRDWRSRAAPQIQAWDVALRAQMVSQDPRLTAWAKRY